MYFVMLLLQFELMALHLPGVRVGVVFQLLGNRTPTQS